MDKGIPSRTHSKRVRVGAELSDEVKVMSGVQGSVLGPLLFLA